ncbi:hypothetical protein DV515_00014079, partial [Chloebia gouldiae]
LEGNKESDQEDPSRSTGFFACMGRTGRIFCVKEKISQNPNHLIRTQPQQLELNQFSEQHNSGHPLKTTATRSPLLSV